jgi:transcriptional regulator with XRE-family HTH domain
MESMTPGTRIRMLRKRHGLSQGELALIIKGETARGVDSVKAGAAGLANGGQRQHALRAWRDMGEALLIAGQPGPALEALRRAADMAGATAASIRRGAEAASHPSALTTDVAT